MRCIPRIIFLATFVLTLPALSGCADFDIDKFDVFGLSDKKKLPGERKPVFPEGVPGVSQGIPPEYIKGNQPPPDTAQLPPAGPDANAPAPGIAADPAKKTAAVEPDAAPKPKLRKPKVAKQKLIPDQSPPPGQAQPPAQDQQPPSAQQSSTAPWPTSPAAGTFSR